MELSQCTLIARCVAYSHTNPWVTFMVHFVCALKERTTGSFNVMSISNFKGILLTKPRFITPKLYDNVVIDPPWPIIWIPSAFNANKKIPYKTLSVQEIHNLPIVQLLKPDAYVFLWTTCSFLKDAFDAIDAWGLRYRQIITWTKDYGMGRPPYTATEHCLMCTNGNPSRPHMKGEAQLLNHFSTTRQRLKHSTKPPQFYEHIKSFTAEKDNLELFARCSRSGWDRWGLESDSNMEE